MHAVEMSSMVSLIDSEEGAQEKPRFELNNYFDNGQHVVTISFTGNHLFKCACSYLQPHPQTSFQT